MIIEHFDDAAKEVVALNTPIERIATGFVFTEGPLWHSLDQYMFGSND